jgi:hypothetical protein
LTERSETTPDSVASAGKKLKKERSEEVQEFQSSLEHKVTPRSFTNAKIIVLYLFAV